MKCGHCDEIVISMKCGYGQQPPLVWSDAKPTVPGWYWWRAPYSHPEMIHLFHITKDSPLVMDRRNGTYMAPNVGQFAGPIPQPEEEIPAK